MAKRCGRPSWEDAERFLRLVTRLAALIELLRKVL
jgi:hypothetical protein